MKKLLEIRAHSESDTKTFAQQLIKLLKPNDVVLLEGNLGTGKTFLVKQICRLLKTEDEASSPSFAIIHQYYGQQPVNHFDFYRLHHEAELDQLGWEELLSAGAISFIEWPELVEKHLSVYYKITIVMDNSDRIFTLYRIERKSLKENA
jgi:tRNA threonylcarbamoyl adenosine modification protein YjeE